MNGEQAKEMLEIIRASREDTIIIRTKVEALEDRGKEDRKKRDAQVTGIYSRLETLAGDYRETKGELEAHVADENRHQGVAPGGGAGKNLAIGAGGAGGLIVLIEVAKQIFGAGG